jgi:hypothetical protein
VGKIADDFGAIPLRRGRRFCPRYVLRREYLAAQIFRSTLERSAFCSIVVPVIS